jgi:ABC-2 type transport system ATP-binding protein
MLVDKDLLKHDKVVKMQEEIKSLIASNDLTTTTKRFLDFTRDFGGDTDEHSALNLCRRYNDVLLKERKNTIDADDAELIKAQLIDTILQTLQDIHQMIENTETVTEVVDTIKKNGKIAYKDVLSDSLDQNEINSNKTRLESIKNEFRGQVRGDNRKQGETRKEISSDNKPFENRVVFKSEGVGKTYRGDIEFKLHLNDLTLKLGEITAIVGENGNGKSTLLNIVAGILAPDKGSISYSNLQIKSKSDPFGPKRQIAHIPQDLPPWQGLLVDNLHFYAAINGIRGKRNLREVEWLIYRLGLDKYRNATWKEISGGYKTRFSLAKALLKSPQLLILDEPLAHLDVNTQQTFLMDLRDLADSLTRPISVLISSQHIYEMESIADNIIFIKDGRPQYQGPVGEVDFDDNCFEVAFQDGENIDIEIAMSLISGARLETVGNTIFIYTSKDITSFEVIKKLSENDVKISYFRDISKSTRRYFEVQYDS